MSAQTLTNKRLRDCGWIVGKTEQDMRIPDKTIPGGYKIFKRDLFGFADLVAVHPDSPGTLYVQTTVNLGSHKTERLEKIEASSATIPLLKAGNQVEFWGWRKIGPRGKRKTWQVSRWRAVLGEQGTERITWRHVSEENVDDDFDAPVPTQATLALADPDDNF
jgi:hypothetical protein